MKKTGLLSALLLCAVLSALVLSAPLDRSLLSSAAEASADQTTAPETDPSTDQPVTDSPSPDDPIVQPKPEPIENSVFLTHSSPLRAGEEVTFTFSCNGEGVRALQGSITYDNTLLTYNKEKSTPIIDNGLSLTIEDYPEEGRLVYVGFSKETDGSSGISQLYSLTFTLSADAVTGNAIPFHVADATALKEQTELTFTGGPCTFLVDRPISDDSSLSELTVSAGSLAPAFDPKETDYRLQVPFDCANLEITALPTSSYAAVEISDTALAIGNNTVTVTVTSEMGTKQVYTLTVTRQPDPNYIPSSDSLLAGITLSDGMLFPAFSPSITEYTVYLVNDGSVTLTPIPAEWGHAEPATLESVDGAVCTVSSVAEDGTTTVYTFKALRVSPEQLAGSTNASSAQIASPGLMQTAIFVTLLITVAVSLFFVGFGVSNLVNKKKDYRAPAPLPDSEDQSENQDGEDGEKSEDNSPSGDR